MRINIKKGWTNFRAWLIIFMVKLSFDSNKREFILKWTELRLGVISKEVFDKFLTREILGD